MRQITCCFTGHRKLSGEKINRIIIQLNGEIDRLIQGWGKSIVEVLAKELQKEFPGVQGLSAANLWRMRNFYLNYSQNEKLAPMVREISWTKDVLINNLENGAYHKYLLNQMNFDDTVPEICGQNAILFDRD